MEAPGRVDRALAAAFAGRISEAENLLVSDESERARWLRAHLAAARGNFDAAADVAVRQAAGARDRSVRAAASRTLASVLRQTGRHAEASRWDRRALRLAATRAERAHALIGLAADAVGMGNASICARRLRAAAASAPAGDARVRIRLNWVRAEHALCLSRPRDAARHARRALASSRRTGARRHEAKSLLFLGAALDAAGDPAAPGTLASAERLAIRLGAAPIADAARALLERGRSRAAR